MKTMAFVSVVSLLTLVISSVAFSMGPEGLLAQPPQKVFLPTHATDQENVEVIIGGYFPDSCYKSGKVEKEIDFERQEISIRHYAAYNSSGFCLMALVPYMKVVDLGVLPAGDYTLSINGKPRITESEILRVRKE